MQAARDTARSTTVAAADVATSAVRAEKSGDLQRAFDLYVRAADALVAASLSEKAEGRRGVLQQCANDAVSGAERVRALMDAAGSAGGAARVAVGSTHSAPPATRVPPAVPPKPATAVGTVTPPVGALQAAAAPRPYDAVDPALVSAVTTAFVRSSTATPQAQTGAAMLGSAVLAAGRGVVAAGETAYDLDQKYQIHQRVASGVAAGLATARELDAKYHVREHMARGLQRAAELNEQHQIHQKVGDVVVAGGKAVLTGVTMAREADEKYNISGRVAEGARTAVAKAVELNDRYQLTDRAAAAAVAAGQSLKALNEEYRITDRAGEIALRGLDQLATLARGASKAMDEREARKRDDAGPRS